MTMKPHRMVIGIVGIGLLAIGLFCGTASNLRAQSPTTPTQESTPVKDAAPDAAPQETPDEKAAQPAPDRSRSYRRDKDPLKDFVPSEEIRVDKAVDFPADI